MARALGELSMGWLDLGYEDQRRAKNLIAQFQSDNTLDELGFGIMRDAFAERFFPATNTIMTRTRYLIFVAGLCWLIEEEELEGKRAVLRLTALENRLREALSREEDRGVIGAQAKEELQRFPSSTYWSALRQLGMFCRPNWGLTYYQKHLSEIRRAAVSDTDDDGLTHVDALLPRNWDRKFCELLTEGRSFLHGPHWEVPDSLNFNLTRSEANYLREKFLKLAELDNRPSVLSHLLSLGQHVKPGLPWDGPYPDELAAHITHARFLSMLSRGATLHYFHLLSQELVRRQLSQRTDVFRELFAKWWDATRQDLSVWNVDDFFVVAGSIGALRRPNDRVFITEWLLRNLAAKRAGKLLDDAEAESLIRDRERITRPNKGRFRHLDYLKRWRVPEPTDLVAIQSSRDTLRFGLTYRAGIGHTFVEDIVTGLSGAH